MILMTHSTTMRDQTLGPPLLTQAGTGRMILYTGVSRYVSLGNTLTLLSSVNLGGLFVIEPFITPSFFEKYPSAVDEWTLSEAMTADTSDGGGLSQLEDHYNTFIVCISRHAPS